MLDLVLETQIDQALTELGAIEREVIPIAISNTVNRLALKSQTGIRVGVTQRFTLRRPDFILKTVKIEKYDFATTRNPQAFRVKIDETRNKSGGRRDVLAPFETGQPKESFDRGFPVAVPSENLRGSRAELIPRSMFPTALRLVSSRGTVGVSYSIDAQGKRRRKNIFGTLPAQQRRTSRGVLQWRGKRRTFVLDPAEHMGVKTWGVYQRTGPGERDVRLLWTYRIRVPRPPILRFEATARDVVDRLFPAEFSKGYAAAVAYSLRRTAAQ